MYRKDQAPQGGGEPAIIGVGAVVGNAIFDATGARLFRVPFTPERVLEAIGSLNSKGLDLRLTSNSGTKLEKGKVYIPVASVFLEGLMSIEVERLRMFKNKHGLVFYRTRA